MPVIPATRRSINKRISVQVNLGIKKDPTSKITRAKNQNHQIITTKIPKQNQAKKNQPTNQTKTQQGLEVWLKQ
jgi:hypothetical protein